jgi:hypothetical protein
MDEAKGKNVISHETFNETVMTRTKLLCLPVDLGTRGGGWKKIVLRGDLRVLSGVQGGFRHSGGGLDVS